MNKILIILLHAGLSLALQYPLEYTYSYQGSIFTGFPEIHKQASAFSLKTIFRVQVNQDGSATFELSEPDTSYSEYNGVLKGCTNDEFPGVFQHITDPLMKQSLLSPFTAHLFDGSATALEVDDQEVLAISNLKKGIVNSFRNELLNGNFGKSTKGIHKVARRIKLGDIPPVFTVKEETIYGICDVQYTAHKIPEFKAQSIEYELLDQIEVDVQRPSQKTADLKTSKTSKKSKKKSSKKYSKKTSKKSSTKKSPLTNIPNIKDDLYRVVRSIDLEHCEVSAHIKNFQAAPRKSPVESYQSIDADSSVTAYLLRGSGGAFRVEKARVHGTHTMNIITPNTESFTIKTDQQYRLIRVEETKKPLDLPSNTKTIDRWMHQFAFPKDAPKIGSPLPHLIYAGKGADVSFLETTYGFRPEDTNSTLKVNMAIDFLKNLAKRMVDTKGTFNKDFESSDKLVGLAQFARYLIWISTSKEVDEMKTKIMVDPYTPEEIMTRKLFVDFLSASRNPHHTKVLLQLIEDGEIDDLHLFVVYMATFKHMMTNVQRLEFLDHILKMDFDEKPFLASTALMNAIGSVRDACIEDDDRFLLDEDQELICKTLAKDTIVPYLRNLFAQPEEWKKVLALTALREMKTPFSLTIVPKIIFGKTGDTLLVKMVAMSLLEPWHLPPIVRTQAMTILETVRSNRGMHPKLRQAAVFSLIFFDPNPHFYYKLATSTFSEPAADMVVFVHSLLENLADNPEVFSKDRSQKAAHALKMIRPVVPAVTFKHSHARYTVQERLKQKFASGAFHTQFNSQRSDSFATQYYSFTSINGNLMELIEFARYHVDGHMPTGPARERDTADSVAKKIAETFYDKIQETVGAESHPQAKKTESDNIYLRMMDHARLFLPMNPETYKTMMFADPVFQASVMAQVMTTGYQNTLGMFFVPYEKFLFSATDLGVPMGKWISSMDFFTANTYVTYNKDDMEGHADITYKEIAQITAGMEFSSVLCKTYYGAMLKRSATVNLPLSLSLKVNSGVSIGSSYTDEFVPITAANVPVTYKFPSSIAKLHGFEEKPVGTSAAVEKVETCSLFGLETKTRWNSQLPSPISLLNPEAFRHFPPSTDVFLPKTFKMWSLAVYFNPATSPVNNVTLSMDIFRGTKVKQVDTGQTTGDFEQYGQESGGFAQYGQESGGDVEIGGFGEFNQDAQNFGQTSGFGQTDSSPQKISEVEVLGGHVFSNLVYGESRDDRLRKLLPYLKDIEEFKSIIAFKIEGTGQSTRSAEFLMGPVHYLASGTRQKRDKHFAILRSPIPGKDPQSLLVCIDFSTKEPRFSHLSTLNSVLSGGKLDAEMSINVLENCQGAPIASIIKHAEMTQEQKDHVAGKISQGKCRGDPLVIAPYDNFALPVETKRLDTNFIYNDVHYEIFWHKMNDRARYPISTTLTNGLSYLYSLKQGQEICSNIDSATGNMKIHMERCSCGKWKMSTGPKFDVNFFNPYVNTFMDYKNSIYGSHRIIDYVAPSSNKKCFITKEQVTTLDGHSYDFMPTKCWTVAMMDCERDDHWMILVRESPTSAGSPEVRYINKKTAVVVDFIGGDVKVNGKAVDVISESETVTDYEGVELAQVYKNADSTVVDLRQLSIAITDKVIITAKNRHELKTCGLCGTNNLAIFDEFLGPHNCLYSHPKMFADAWTGPSDKCDLYTILGVREAAEKYQKKCTKMDALKQEAVDELPDHHISIGWKIIKFDDDYCMSDMPMGYCEDGYESISDSEVEVDFKCYSKKTAPTELTDAINADLHYVNFPEHGRPLKHVKKIIDLPDACAKKMK